MLRRRVNDHFNALICTFEYVLYLYTWDSFAEGRDVAIFPISIVFDCHLINKYTIRKRLCFHGI